MTTVNIKQHDTKGIFLDTLIVDGVPVDLSGSTIFFLMRKASVFVRQTAEVFGSAVNGTVQYQPVDADVAVAGKFEQEWEVLFGDGRTLTFPNGDYNIVNILGDLDNNGGGVTPPPSSTMRTTTFGDTRVTTAGDTRVT
jgi:BppU N-terminal domain